MLSFLNVENNLGLEQMFLLNPLGGYRSTPRPMLDIAGKIAIVNNIIGLALEVGKELEYSVALQTFKSYDSCL